MCGSEGKKYSQAESSCLPGTPPIASTVVFGSFATAERRCFDVVEVDHRARRRVDLLAVDGERRVAR